MSTFILRRLLTVVPVLLLVSIIEFINMRLIPGDPVDVMYGVEGISQETRVAM